uniref:Integrase core domain containing protein n=1 Tax=Solanum tuberosum TaxID=4113 RepID=M1DJW0_SOLTU
MKLRRFKQEIREMEERRIEIEVATAAAQAKSAALDAELAAKMARYVIMNEETTVMPKEHDIERILKLLKGTTSKGEPGDVHDETFDPVGIEIWKPFPYHGAIDHNVGMCLEFRYLELVCVGMLSDHLYFIRSKASKYSLPGQNSQKGKVVMGDNNEEIGLTNVVVAQPISADQNELIMQLMQQITEMRVEMQRRQDLPNLVFAFNALADGRPLLHFPASNAEQAQNPPFNPAQNPSNIDLTTKNPHYASAYYQTPPHPQSTNPQAPLPPQNADLQTCPPP